MKGVLKLISYRGSDRFQQYIIMSFFPIGNMKTLINKMQVFDILLLNFYDEISLYILLISFIYTKVLEIEEKICLVRAAAVRCSPCYYPLIGNIILIYFWIISNSCYFKLMITRNIFIFYIYVVCNSRFYSIHFNF